MAPIVLINIITLVNVIMYPWERLIWTRCHDIRLLTKNTLFRWRWRTLSLVCQTRQYWLLQTYENTQTIRKDSRYHTECSISLYPYKKTKTFFYFAPTFYRPQIFPSNKRIIWLNIYTVKTTNKITGQESDLNIWSCLFWNYSIYRQILYHILVWFKYLIMFVLELFYL